MSFCRVLCLCRQLSFLMSFDGAQSWHYTCNGAIYGITFYILAFSLRAADLYVYAFAFVPFAYRPIMSAAHWQPPITVAHPPTAIPEPPPTAIQRAREETNKCVQFAVFYGLCTNVSLLKYYVKI